MLVFTRFCTLFFATFLCAILAHANVEPQLKYENKRYGYSIVYPNMFGEVIQSRDGKGMSTSSSDGQYTLALTCAKNDGKSADVLLKQALAKNKNVKFDSEQSSDDLFVFIYEDGKKVYDFLQYTIVSEKKTATFVFRYPTAFGDKPEFNEIIKSLGWSFTFTK